MISGILSSLSRLSIGNVQGTGRTFTTNTLPLYFNATQILCGEPLKKKKRIDPAILKRRFERKTRKLQKEIRRLERVKKTPKPILELQVPREIFTEKKLRIRNLPKIKEEVTAERKEIKDKWAHYKLLEYRKDMDTIQSILYSQEKALNALREESEELYQEAIQLDPVCLPYKISGATVTPAIVDYDIPDGDYTDITKKYEGE
ncbi:39S ribosomal protein L40, mitochondrial [Leptopilina heterotoma]|uniref:39S ribosomal protein L40, mitochondrial n=1 Tax=Leptopilina heterotoma TaxID=63436 RepID=UPI001CA9BBAD|nr:39S ribosomal protein L40, mitochondrial [Leptopilina heterotoma]